MIDFSSSIDLGNINTKNEIKDYSILNDGNIKENGYKSPEILLEKKISKKSDVYSCGVILFNMLTGTLANNQYFNNYEKIKEFLDKETEITKDAKNLIL